VFLFLSVAHKIINKMFQGPTDAFLIK
jgi:hypothetical protein